MKVMNDIIKLIIFISLVAAIIFGVHYLGTQGDNQAKYKHPITRPGASW